MVAGSSSFADTLVAAPALVSGVFELPAREAALFPGDPATELVRMNSTSGWPRPMCPIEIVVPSEARAVKGLRCVQMNRASGNA